LRVRVHEAAAAEFREAVEFYEARVEGLGSELAAEVAGAFDDIADAPERWPVIFSTEDGAVVRRFVLKRFPLSVFYEVKDATPMVLALGHDRQRPGYWRRRTKLGR
jgi:toxin ParE1/3/4